MTEIGVKNAKLLAQGNHKLYTYEKNWQLSQLFKKRKELGKVIPEDCPEVEVLSTVGTRKRVIISDSHGLSIYRAGDGLARYDGKTLRGALRDGGKHILERINESTEDVYLYFGNIDVRYHVNLKGGIPYLQELLNGYVNVIDRLIDKGLKVKVQGLLPVEDKSRVLPESIKFNGVTFNGSMEERQGYVDYFNGAMRGMAHLYGYEFVEWEMEYPLDFAYMEKPRSVHLAPHSYLHINTFWHDTRVPTLF